MISDRMILLNCIFAIYDIIAVSVDSYYFTTVFSWTFFKQYGGSYFAHCYGLLLNVLHPVVIKMFAGQLRMFERLFIVDTSNISDQTAGLLVYIKHKINAMFVAMIVASLATTGVNVYFWCQDRDQIMLTSKLLTDYFSPGSIIVKLFNFIETFADIIACIPTVTIPAYFIYLFYHVEVQLLLLTDYVRSLHNEHERTFTNKMGLSTENYHSISNSVKKIVKWHLEIKQYNYEIFAINQMVHFLYICTGLLVSIFSLFSLFSVNIPYENTVNSMHLSEAIYDLDWYNWDVKCQKLYLMLITHTTKGIQVTIFMLFGINKELLKKIAKLLYPVMNLLYSASKSN
ncbi:uncharacterized protein LOC109544464 isoform X3 [Dendroctonus ponderosae]|uniref:uncharacterized protein LOC109544464 isoform X3 n=1 Tax=Dendroctonus ponderosae TaxID=77166 RepID=UPI002034EEF5|nr:uncharacterized protein LOC109544464 isoform X3 [Dendroctonus ponderosae]